MTNRKIVAAAAMTAALATGGLVGATLGSPLTSGAQDAPTTTTTPATGSTEKPAGDHVGRGPGGGVDLEAAATALGITEDELQTQLQAGKTLAEVAEAQGVDKQMLIDALVTAAEARLDEAKAALPERMAELVDRTLPARGEGGGPGRGGPGGGFGRGADLEAAATALGITEDELKTQLQGGTTLAEVAEAQGVEKQTLIDALVASAKEKLAAAVTDGTLTQAEADERAADLTERITARVDGEGPQGGFGGHGPGGRGPGGGGPDAPADDEGTTTTTTP